MAVTKSPANNSTHLIFDFDGTLVDSFHTVINTFNLLADEFHFRKIDSHEIEAMRDLTSRELIKFLNIPIYKIPRIIRKARKELHHDIPLLPTFANLSSVLHTLHHSNISLGILTSNSEENVIDWLNTQHLKHLFKFIHVESHYFGKKRVLKKIITSNNIQESNVFYIGDETRDIDAAKACHINSIAVTWGFNSEKILSKHQPHFIARKPEDLLSICSV